MEIESSFIEERELCLKGSYTNLWFNRVHDTKAVGIHHTFSFFFCKRRLSYPPKGSTLFTASRKSFSFTVLRRWRIANIPASLHTLRMSAPVAFGHSLARSSNLHANNIWWLDLRAEKC